MKLDLETMTAQQRLTAWKNLAEPKPDWETFKRLLVSTDGDVFATRSVWIAKRNKRFV